MGYEPTFSQWKTFWEIFNGVLFLYVLFFLIYCPLKLRKLDSRLKVLENEQSVKQQ